VTDSLLACTVRGCGLPLVRRERTWTCAGGHAFDVARSGYVNLLQPQDRRSPEAGDSKAAIDARSQLLAAGVGRTVVDAVAQRAAGLDLPADAPAVDLGSGSGELLAALTALRSIGAVGIDLSTAAAEHAARRFPAILWVVANADRRLPVLDGRAGLMLSLYGRRNPAECARTLAPGGSLIVAVPAADDLLELRERIQGSGVERDRAERVIDEHAPWFTLRDRWTVRERPTLERDALVQLLAGTYRGARLSTSSKVESLERMDVTLASEILQLEPRR
jgi:23S rRNA (guanine745-N1)-methyltransferase